jgi:hypothetical protein
LLYDLAILPFKEFFDALNAAERSVFYTLLAAAAALGFVLGRRRSPGARRYKTLGAWRCPSFQNSGEELVSRILLAHFRAPDYHLMNHVTLRMDDGTTQVDHILVSRFGVFVIETKDYNGWLFASESDAKWTNVHYHLKYKFQNPIRQNFRHVIAVQNVLEFVPRGAIKSVVVFCGSAEFKTDVPAGVVHVDELIEYLKRHTVELLALNRMQYAVGRLETRRLALSGKTDVAHIESLRRRLGGDAV